MSVCQMLNVQFRGNAYVGYGQSCPTDSTFLRSQMSPQPFSINVPQPKIDLLKQKLSLAKYPDEIEGSDWHLGPPVSEVKRLAQKWQEWDWREAEKKLNEYPNFHADIEVENFGTLDIHFLHQRSEVEEAIPLLFVHGWPGSFIEVLKILSPLTRSSSTSASNTDAIPAFHIIAPSLPNFGFSQGVTKRGFGLVQYAETCHKLMLQLGYNTYATQAGDWGFWITRAIGRLYPTSCLASHLNMIYALTPKPLSTPLLYLQNLLTPFPASERRGSERSKWFRDNSSGYNKLQSTRPLTLSSSLTDSPLGLLAWIYEKLHDWSDTTHYTWSDDEILTWVSIYWFSRAGPGAAGHIYYEVSHTKPKEEGGTGGLTYWDVLKWQGSVKLGLTYNPKELEIFPKLWGRGLGRVVFERENEVGGHFYATEHPDLLIRDLRDMFGAQGKVYSLFNAK
ncbi:MAG: hypothetical protein Q9190_000957 [Brigantiaea leucoxantha]